MKLTDQIKAKADELDLSGKLDQFGDAATKALAEAKTKAGNVAHDAKSKAASVAHDSKDKVESLLDKAGSAIDGKTDGKYADKVAKAKDKTNELVDKVAKHRPGAGEPEAPKATEPEA